MILVLNGLSRPWILVLSWEEKRKAGSTCPQNKIRPLASLKWINIHSTIPFSLSLPLSLVEIISRNKIFSHLSVALNWEILEHDGDFIPKHLQIIFCGVYTTAFQVFWRRLLWNLKQHHALETKSVHGTSVPSDRDGNSR